MFRKICNIINALVMIGLLTVAALLLGPRLLGYQSMAVISGSMEPGIPVGSVVLVKKADPTTLKAGDVITYSISDATMVTHRVVEVDQENQLLTTKGDANNANDANPVQFANVVGKMGAHIPYVGYIYTYLKTPLGIGLACGVLIILILANFLPGLLDGDKKKDSQKKSKNIEKTAE